MAGKVSSNPNEFLLPDLGEGLESADLIEWCVKVGQTVKEFDILAKVETDKAVAEVPSDRDGVIAILHGEAGDRIPVYAPFVTFEGGAISAKPASGRSESGNGAHQPAPPPSRLSSPKKEAEREDAGTVVGSLTGADYTAEPGKVRAAPAVRRLARDLGVDLEKLAGSGIGGRITSSDVQTAARGAAATGAPARRAAPPADIDLPARIAPIPASRPAPVAIPAGQDSVRVPMKGVRKVIAERLIQSVHTAVHFTVMDEADISRLDRLRKQLINATGEKISFLPFVCTAVARMLSDPQFARLNSLVDDKNQEIVQYRTVHLGIATDTENGLMVPVLRNTASLGVVEIGRSISRLAQTARDRTIAREDLSGSTFTVSNVGSLAGRFATPIINYPEVAIIAVGRAREAVVVRDGLLGVGRVLPLSLSCDHRVIDGGMAATALARVIELLQSPDDLVPSR